MNNYRWIICIDLIAPDLPASYAFLHKFMELAEGNTLPGNPYEWPKDCDFEGWESTDEAYCQQSIKDPLDPADVQKARMAYFSLEDTDK